MTGEAVRRTGPASSREPNRASSSSRQDAALEPGQDGTDAEVGTEPEGNVGVRVAGGIEPVGVVTENRLVTVGRCVEHEHRLARLPVDARPARSDGSWCA